MSNYIRSKSETQEAKIHNLSLPLRPLRGLGLRAQGPARHRAGQRLEAPPQGGELVRDGWKEEKYIKPTENQQTWRMEGE